MFDGSILTQEQLEKIRRKQREEQGYDSSDEEVAEATVDISTVDDSLTEDGRTYKDNSWEYFFEKPCGYSLNDIDSDSEVIISDNTLRTSNKDYCITGKALPISNVIISDKHLKELKSRYQTFFKLSPTAKSYVEDIYNQIMVNNTDVLGVLCRGTDYTVRRSFGEPVQPRIDQVIKKVHEFLKKHPEIAKIYLATEDDSIYQIFKKEFGEKLLDNNQYRYSYSGKENRFLSDIKIERPNHNYQLALEYLSSLYILSKCKYFIGGRCGGSTVAWIWQNCWEDLYIWKLGYYGKGFKNRLFAKLTQRKNEGDYVVYYILGIKFKFQAKNKNKK